MSEVNYSELDENLHASFPFVSLLQHSLIKLMIENREFGTQALFHIKPQYFGDFRLGWFVKFIQKYHQLYNDIPEKVVFENEILKFPPDERVAYQLIFQKILDADISRPSYLQDQLQEFIRSSIIKRGVETIVKEHNSNAYDSALQSAHDMFQEANKIDFKTDVTFDFKRSWDLFAKLHDATKGRIPLGIPPIDQALIGGVAKKQLLTFIGGTNIGKSVILVNCLVNMVKDGHRVLYIDLENDDLEVPARIWACYTGIHYNALARHRHSWKSSDQRLVDEAIPILDDKACVKVWHDYSVCAEDLVGYVERKFQQWPFDVLIIDYAQLLKMKSARKTDNSYTEHGAVFKMLSLLAIRNNIAVITVAQGTRGAQTKNSRAKGKDDLLVVTDIADSFEVIRKSGVVITVTRSAKNMQDNEIIFLLDKQRRGRTQVAVKFFTDFDKIRVFNRDMKHELYGGNEATELEEYAGMES